MNFNQEFWHVLTNNGPIYFWMIAIPITIGIMLIITFSYIMRLVRTLGRHFVRRNIKIKLRKNREMRRHKAISLLAVASAERVDSAVD